MSSAYNFEVVLTLSLPFAPSQTSDNTLRDVFAKMGGLVSAVGVMVVFLIGTSRLSPWGVLAEIPYFRRRVAKDLNRYGPGDALHGPFKAFRRTNGGQEEVERIGSFTSALQREGTVAQLLYLKKRIDLLEIALSDYYLDTEVFEDATSESTSHNSQRRRQTANEDADEEAPTSDVPTTSRRHDNGEPGDERRGGRRRSWRMGPSDMERPSTNHESPSVV